MQVNQKAHIQSEYRVRYPDPINVAAGVRVSVGREDDGFLGWQWCRATDGREGWVPSELLSCEGSEAIVVQDYSARELSARPGDELVVEQERHGWLFVRNARSAEWFETDLISNWNSLPSWRYRKAVGHDGFAHLET